MVCSSGFCRCLVSLKKKDWAMTVGIFVVVWCVMISSSMYNCLLNVTGSPQDKGTKIMITQMNGKNLLSVAFCSSFFFGGGGGERGADGGVVALSGGCCLLLPSTAQI